MKTREQLAREWAEGFSRDVTSVTHEHAQAAIAFILEATKPKNLADLCWNSEKHFLMGVNDGYQDLVALDLQRLVDGGPMEILACDIDGSDGVTTHDPAGVTPNGKRFRLAEETDNPKVLNSESDYRLAPVGTVVCKPECHVPFAKASRGHWEAGDHSYASVDLAGDERSVLRWGYGESHA